MGTVPIRGQSPTSGTGTVPIRRHSPTFEELA
jgi:hypothetical protein